MATKKTTKKEKASKPVTGGKKEMYEGTILRPRISEKATVLAEKNVLTFEIGKNVTKSEVKKAIKTIWNILPKKINILSIPNKRVTMRGKKGVRGGGKKVVVYLREGDKIEI